MGFSILKFLDSDLETNIHFGVGPRNPRQSVCCVMWRLSCAQCDDSSGKPEQGNYRTVLA